MKGFMANVFVKYTGGYECFDKLVYLGFIDTSGKNMVYYPTCTIRHSAKCMEAISRFINTIGGEMKKTTLQKRIEKLEKKLNKLLQKSTTTGLTEKPNQPTVMEYLKGIPSSDKTATETIAAEVPNHCRTTEDRITALEKKYAKLLLLFNSLKCRYFFDDDSEELD